MMCRVAVRLLTFSFAAVCALAFRADATGGDAADVAAAGSDATGGVRVALLPFENLSTSEEGQRELAPLLIKALEAHGWTVVSGDVVEKALDENRMRYLDSLDGKTRGALAASLQVGTFAIGTIYGYAGADQPFVAFSLRLVAADGRVLFQELVSLRPEDTEAIFTFGEPVSREALAREAVRRIARRLPRPGAKLSAEIRRAKPLRLAAPATYRSQVLASGERHRVAILPFANAAYAREAPRVAMSLLSRRLSDSSLFTPVEPADLRAGLVAEKVRDYSDPAQLRSLGTRLGTTLFLSGTIYDYSDATRGGNGTPRLEIALTLTDVASGAVVWTSYAQRQGTDYSGFLALGAITNITGLVDQASYEMVHAAEKTKPTREAAPKTIKASVIKKETKS